MDIESDISVEADVVDKLLTRCFCEKEGFKMFGLQMSKSTFSSSHCVNDPRIATCQLQSSSENSSIGTLGKTLCVERKLQRSAFSIAGLYLTNYYNVPSSTRLICSYISVTASGSLLKRALICSPRVVRLKGETFFSISTFHFQCTRR